MRLHEHPDFEQAIVRASEHFQSRGLRPALVEKDYDPAGSWKAGDGEGRR